MSKSEVPSNLYDYRLLHMCPETENHEHIFHEWTTKLEGRLPKACPECKSRIQRFGHKHVILGNPLNVIFFYRDKDIQRYGWGKCPDKYRKALQKAVKEHK